jgi:hypothetical protein
MKYIIKGINYDLPQRVTVKLYKQLKAAYDDLLSQMPAVDLTILQAKMRYQVKLMDLVKELCLTSTDPVKLDKAYSIVMGLLTMERPEADWLFKVDFTETQSQREYLTEIARAIHDYNKKNRKTGREQTLNEKVVRIETILNVKINVRECSVLMFREYERQAIEKINEKNKWQAANK